MNEREAKMPADSDLALSGVYRAASAEIPPAQLDAAIQAAARRAVGARPQATGFSFLRAWRVPLSIAAVLVMSVSMVTLTVRQKGVQVMEPEYVGPAATQRSEPVPQPLIAARPDPGNAVVEHKSVRATNPAASLDAAPAEAVADRAPAAAEVAGKALPIQHARKQEGATASALVEGGQAFSPTEESAVAAKEHLATAPAQQLAKGLRAPASAAPELAASAEGRSMRRDRTESGLPAAVADTTSQVSIFIRELDKQPPGKWLEKIAALRQQGKVADADALLAEFTKRNPNHPLPFPAQ
jgi:hypothetical protein